MQRRQSSSSGYSRVSLSAAVALAVSSSVLAFLSSASGAVSGSNGKIAFHSDRNGNQDIFAVAPNGLGEVLLIGGAANDTDPAFSPDGSKMAFVSDRSGNADIWVGDGSTQLNITDSPGADIQPAWSPDGTRVAFVSTRDRNPEIYVTSASGGPVTRLTFNAVPDGSPAWSPDGSRLAFGSNRDGDSDIFVMDIETGAVKPFTDNPFADHSPAWSPDGAWIAFDSDASGSRDIFVGGVDGSAPARLTTSLANETSAAWAPNGSRLAFEAQRNGATDIFSIGLDGTLVVRATSAPSGEGAPDWRVLQPGDQPTAAERDRAEQAVATSESVTTDALGNGATAEDVVVSSVTAAVDGVITIDESESVQAPPDGGTFFGQQINISAPPGTPDKPLRFVFRLDAARVPSGADELTIGMWRNRAEVPPCQRVDGVATPDPCMLSVRKLDDGDILLVGISSQASSWNFGLRAPRQIGDPDPSPAGSPSPSPSPSGSLDVIRPTITGSATPPQISPNGDGRRDSLDVEAVFSEPVTWTFTVTPDTSSTPVSTTGGEGEFLALTWDGAGADTDGRYIWAVTAHDAAGNEAIPLQGDLTIDRMKPGFSIGAPRRVSKSAPISVKADEDASVKVTIRKRGAVIKAFPERFLGRTKTLNVRWRRPPAGRYKIVVSVTDVAGNKSTKRQRLRVR